MKECPYCDEQIQSSAKKCRYCGEWLDNDDISGSCYFWVVNCKRINKLMTDFDLIYTPTIFHAYFCHLIDTDQADYAEELCEISWKLDQEIKRRRISDSQVKECINRTILNPEDQFLVRKYIYVND